MNEIKVRQLMKCFVKSQNSHKECVGGKHAQEDNATGGGIYQEKDLKKHMSASLACRTETAGDSLQEPQINSRKLQSQRLTKTTTSLQIQIYS